MGVIVILLSMKVTKNGTKFVPKSSLRSFLMTNTNAQQIQQNNRSVAVYNTSHTTTVSLPRYNSTLHHASRHHFTYNTNIYIVDTAKVINNNRNINLQHIVLFYP